MLIVDQIKQGSERTPPEQIVHKPNEAGPNDDVIVVIKINLSMQNPFGIYLSVVRVRIIRRYYSK